MHFPVFVDLTEKNILVVGAGAIASRRIGVLLDFAGRITVVAPVLCAQLQKMQEAKRPGLVIHRRRFRESDLEERDLVLAATDDEALNREIAALCARKKIPVNVSSDQSLCDFQFPSVVQIQDLVVGLNASGRDHRLVKEMRRKVEKLLLPEGQNGKYAKRTGE